MGNSSAGLPVTASLELRLGALLARAGILSHERLERALGLQASRDARLGEVLVEMGLIDRVELNAVLALQKELREAPDSVAPQDRLRLGRLLLDAGVIDERTLEQAVARHRASGRRLGETLVQAGAISRQTLDAFLARQRRLVAVAMAGLAVVGAAAPAPVDAAGSHRIDIQATVVRHATISGLRAPQSLSVTPEDVERGYLDLDQPVEVNIRSNDAQGLVLGISLNSPLLETVDVREAGGAQAGRGPTVFVPKLEKGLREQNVWLKLRIRLSPHAVPGIIAHPISISLQPL